MLARTQNIEPPMILRNDGVDSRRIHDTVPGCEDGILNKQPAQSVKVAIVDHEAIAGNQLPDL